MDYTYSSVSYYAQLDWREKSHILICSFDELVKLFGGTLPHYVVHDEAFFEDHALIALRFGSPGIPYYVELGDLTMDENGIYHLESTRFEPHFMSEVVWDEYVLLEVDGSIEPGSSLELHGNRVVIESGNFLELFPKAFGFQYGILEGDPLPTSE